MNVTFIKAVIALVPVGAILCGAAILFRQQKTAGNLLQLIGPGCLILVVFAHLCEALQVFPSMLWGRANSIGHYFDLFSVVLGFALFPLGYLLHALARQNAY